MDEFSWEHDERGDYHCDRCGDRVEGVELKDAWGKITERDIKDLRSFVDAALREAYEQKRKIDGYERLEAENAALRERIEQLQRPTATRERLERAEGLLRKVRGDSCSCIRTAYVGDFAPRHHASCRKAMIDAYFEEVRDGE